MAFAPLKNSFNDSDQALPTPSGILLSGRGEPAALVTLAHALAYAQLHRIRPRIRTAALAHALAYAFAHKPGPPQKATPTYRSTTFKG